MKGQTYMAVFHKATPLLLGRLHAAGCHVYRGDASYFHRVYALHEVANPHMDFILERHRQSLIHLFGPYTDWIPKPHHTRIFPKQ